MNNRSLIIKSIKSHPENWFIDKYWCVHKPTGYKLWIANGRSFFQSDHGFPRLSFWDRLVIWPHFSRMKAEKLNDIWREAA